MQQKVCVVRRILELALCERSFRPITVLMLSLIFDGQVGQAFAVLVPEFGQRVTRFGFDLLLELLRVEDIYKLEAIVTYDPLKVASYAPVKQLDNAVIAEDLASQSARDKFVDVFVQYINYERFWLILAHPFKDRDLNETDESVV